MSFHRKNWTALSSLAEQWNAEDEEEQKRERRRRHRQLSSTSDSVAETPSPVQNSTGQASDRSQGSSEIQPSKKGSSNLANVKKQVDTLNKQDDRRIRRKIEILNNVKPDKKEKANVGKLEEVDKEEKTKDVSEPAQEQKNPIVENHQGLSQPEEKHPSEDQEKRELTTEKHKNVDQAEEDPKMGKDQGFGQVRKIVNAHESKGLVAGKNEATPLPQRAPWERRSISRLEVKINSRVRSSTDVSPPSLFSAPQATERDIPKIADAEKSAPDQDGLESSPPAPHSAVIYSSSFKRISPRTISFRVVSGKDKQETTLSRSASMRLPASTVKLGEKLEKYTSAVQRSGSIKLHPSVRRNFQPLSEGVASKRSIFEANVPVRAEPTSPVRKESLKIQGGVTSRINLWISRTQEPSKDEGTRDHQNNENTPKRSQWVKRSSES